MSENTTNNETINNEAENISAAKAYASITAVPSVISFSKNESSTVITVSCADLTWSVGGGSSWCKIIKTSNTTAKITVATNYGGTRSMAVVCVNGPNVATISITQKGEVSYDRSGMITVYKQPTGKSCATTCAAMCVNRSPETLQNDGFDLEWAIWGKIASHYGYSTTGVDYCTISDVFNTLKAGYPVIAYVNDGSNGETEHWVVVTKYNGNGTDMSASNFTCADPWTGTTVALNNATNFNKVTQCVVFKLKS